MVNPGKPTEKSNIPGKRPGRRDYSSAVSVSSMPMARRHQVRTSGTIKDTTTFPPGGWSIVVTSPKVDLLMSMFSVHVKIDPHILTEFWFGAVDYDAFINTSLTVSDLLDCTIVGPLQRHYNYGGTQMIFSSPISFKTQSKYDYWYLFYNPGVEEETDVTIWVDKLFISDKYV